LVFKTGLTQKIIGFLLEKDDNEFPYFLHAIKALENISVLSMFFFLKIFIKKLQLRITLKIIFLKLLKIS
jgi:hypothetical protein